MGSSSIRVVCAEKFDLARFFDLISIKFFGSFEVYSIGTILSCIQSLTDHFEYFRVRSLEHERRKCQKTKIN